MRLRKILAGFLALTLLVTALPVGMISRAEGSGSGQTSTTVNSSNAAEYLFLNRYQVNSGNIGQLSGCRGDIIWDNPSLYEKPTGIYTTVSSGAFPNTDRWPYIAVKVNVEETRGYDISTVVKTSGSKYDTFGMIVDGVTHVLKFTDGQETTVTQNVKLTKGEHIIVFTPPMPEDPAAETQNVTNNPAYPWFDFYSFTFGSGMTVTKPTREEVHASVTGATRLEAEDTKYVKRRIYNEGQTETYASGGIVVGGMAYRQCQQTFADLEANGLVKEKMPYLQYAVEAPKEGYYYITIGAGVGSSNANNKKQKEPYVAVLVNGVNPVKAQFDGGWGKLDSVTVPVYLEKGINIVTCTSMVKDDERYEVDSSGWVNIDYFQLQKGLTAKPVVVNGTDGNYADYLFLNGYALSGTYFGQAKTNNNNIEATIGDLRYDYPSLYGPQFGIYSNVETTAKRAGKWPYIAFKIHAEQSGEYTISTKVNMKPENTVLHQTFGMIVDGATYVLEVEEGKESSSTLSQNVYLTAGEHVVIFTVPMPRDAKTASNYSDGDTGNNTRYTWFNYHEFSVSDGLIFSGKPNSTDIQSAMTSYTRVEAENEAYVAYNMNYGTDVSKAYNVRYNSKGETNKTETYIISGAIDSAIDDSASVTEKSVNTTQIYADIEAGKLDKELTSYIHYVVKAEKAGTYVLRVGAYVEGEGTMPYGTILVNGKAYKAQFSGNWNGWDAVNLPVELKEGINAIQCVGITADQTSFGTAWIGYDYLDIPEGVTACDIEVKATDGDYGKYLYLNRYKYQANENNFGGPNYDDMRYDYPSLYEEMLGIYSDIKAERTNYWPYIAFTVRAEQAGEYEISANIGTNGNAKTIGMLVDGAMHVIDVTATSGYLTKSVYLTAGEHVIIFTSPIFRDMVSRPTTTGTNVQYPYLNYISFKLSAGLCFVERPTDADIQTAMTNYLRVEAEDVDYASANGNYNANISKDYKRRYDTPYTVKVKGATGAVIDGTASADEKSVNTTQTYTEIETNKFIEESTSYVQYKVTAKEAGNYVIRIGAYVEGSGTMPYGTILVNGKAYQAQFSGNWNGYDAVNLAVELQAGENIIQCIGVTADQTGTDGWIGYDYLEIPRGLTYHDAGEYTDTSVESGLTFEKRTTYETDGAISQAPYTISAWVYLPSGYTSRGGVIFGNYKDGATPCASFEINANGVPRFYHINGNGVKVDLPFDMVSVCADEWTNITYTISGNTVSCYKNGVLAGTKTGDIDMSAVKNQYVLGGDLRQEIATSGTTNTQYFKGRIIDVALYGEDLSADDVLKVYKAETITTEPYTRYKLENAEKGEDVLDEMGNNHLDAKSAYFTNKEAVTDYAYSFAVVGDTQIVTENDVNNKENNLSKIYDWILANKEEKKIQYVFGLGDITDNNNKAEWAHAKEQLQKLDGNIPYSIVRGNHDLVGSFSAEDKTADYMTQYLGTEAYKSQFTEDGFYDANISNSWRTFTVGQVKYLMLALDFGPSDDVLNWAGDIIKNHPDHSVIITTHAYLYRNGTTLDANEVCPPIGNGGYNNGDHIWTKLVSKYENIVLVMSGHDPSDNIVMSRDVGVNGNVVTSMLIDPQGVDSEDGSTGMLAMLYFSEDGTKVQVEYISTVRNEYFKEDNQFSFEFKIDDCERIVKPYSAQQVADFKTYGTYPKDVEGYLFAGWYTDEACDEASLLGTATPTETTYALFVPKHVLDVKAQISGNLLNSDATDDGTASIRFVTTIDSLLYQKVGFEISYTDDSGQKQEFVSANGTVYQKLYAINSSSKIDTLTPNKYFCGLSTYFKACTITDIPADYYDTVFTIKPFWITVDGATVYGDTVTKTVNQGIPRQSSLGVQ